MMTAVRFTLTVMDMAEPVLLTEFTKYLEGGEDQEYMT